MSGNLNLDTTIFYNELQSRLDGVSSETSSTDLVKLFRVSELYDAADYTIFAAEVQSRINAVDEFTSDTELLKLAAALAKIANKNQDDLQLLLDTALNQSSSGTMLAPDLDYIANKISPTINYRRISGIDPSAGYVTALSLTGKFKVTCIRVVDLLASGNIDVRLTVDGQLKWDSSIASTGTTLTLLGTIAASNPQESITCKSSLLLEIQKIGDNDISLDYLARPIL